MTIDVDGVLVDGRPPDGRHWATSIEADLGLNFEMLQDAFFNRYWDEILTGRADIRERLAVALLAISPGLTVDEPLTYWFQHDSRLNRELLNDLAALRDAGLRVYRRLIRNTHERSI